MIPNRLERSHLYVPAPNWAMIQKAAVSAADAVVLDLEDAVSLGDKVKQCIHPAQLAAVNAEFSPSEQESARARAMFSALEQARQAGRGAVSPDGRMIDAANLRLARSTIKQQALIDRRTTG